MIAFQKYGFWKGGILTAWRLLRCNPLGKLLVGLSDLLQRGCSWFWQSLTDGAYTGWTWVQSVTHWCSVPCCRRYRLRPPRWFGEPRPPPVLMERDGLTGQRGTLLLQLLQTGAHGTRLRGDRRSNGTCGNSTWGIHELRVREWAGEKKRKTTVQFSKVQYSTIQCSTVPFSAVIVQHSTVQYSAVQQSTVQHSTYSTVQYSTVQYSAVQHVQYIAVQYSTAQHSTVQYCIVSTAQCITVQLSTVQYSTVQQGTVQYSTLLVLW